jgi:hypothetical protein
MAQKHQSYYMVIPAEVWDAEITAKAMILYGHIQVLANKKKYCYANNSYFAGVMKTSGSTIGRAMKELEDNNLIYRELVYKEGSKEVEERKIFLTIGIFTRDNRPIVNREHSPIVTSDQDNSTRSNNTRSNNKLDDSSVNDIKGKIFFKIVELYPANRIGNRQHGLKKFNKLDIEQAKLCALNLKRYLKAAGTYVKSLQNYIEEECWTEEWLKAEETKSKKLNKTNTKHNIPNNYDNID